MKAVFKHELHSHFTNLTGYVFCAFLLLFTGIYTLINNLGFGYSVTNFEYVLRSISFVFLFIVPVLTMRVLAEERKQKTDQLLYSLPLSMSKVVLGKFLALLMLFLVPVLIMSVYPLILSAYGNVYLPMSYGALLYFVFLGAALISIGVYVSSVTENQAVAAGLCFVVMLVNFYISDLTAYLPNTASASFAGFVVLAAVVALISWRMTKNSTVGLLVFGLSGIGLAVVYFMDSARFEGLFPALIGELSLFERFDVYMTGGIFDLTSLVYFASIVVVFLFLSIQSMEKRRWSE